MIIDEIKKDNVQAIKDKNMVARAILGVAISKHLAQSIEKRKTGAEITDADMIAILQKTIKELNEEAENYAKVGKSAQVEEIKTQKTMLEKYLPQMMSEDEIKAVIASLEDKSIPSVMKHFKANYAGKVDMQLVNKIARG